MFVHPWIEMHSHLLPGLDDGCQTMEQALTAAEQMMYHGIVGAVCTPHIWPDAFGSLSPHAIYHAVQQFSQALRRHGLAFQVWPGAEIRISETSIDWMLQHGVPTLGSSRFVLLDYFGDYWPQWADRTIDWLIGHRYRPILAHPERLDLPDDQLIPLLDRLAVKRVALQGNLGSLMGCDGPRSAQLVREFLAAGRYALLAGDLHHPAQLPDRMGGLIEAEMLVGPRACQHMTWEMVQRMKLGESVVSQPVSMAG